VTDPRAELARLERLYGTEPDVMARYLELDRKLVERGFVPTSPWWLDTLSKFYRTKKRTLVPRVGRRGGKSSTLCRVGVTEALHGNHRIPEGDVGVVAIVSVDRREAGKRILTVRSILDALGVAHRPIDGGVQLVDAPIAFQVFTGTISGVSGFTAICVICDEVSKWRDSDTGANPATEVLASIKPTMATMRRARLFLSSSPMGELDAHAAAYRLGDDDAQSVAYAPTWIANPSVTEAETHKDERDELKWRREYAAIPLEDHEHGVFASVLLDAATRAEPTVPREEGCTYVAAMDPAMRGDAWTLVVGTRRWVDGKVKRSVVLAKEWRGTVSAPLDPDVVLLEVKRAVGDYGISVVYSDQASADALKAIGRRHELSVVIEPSTHAGNLARYESLSTYLADEQVEIPPDPQLRADLLSVRKRLTSNGFTIELPRTGDRHADYAPAVALCLTRPMAEPPPLPTGKSRAQLEAEEHDRTMREHWVKVNELQMARRRENESESFRDAFGPFRGQE
jgi:hypothetical protein